MKKIVQALTLTAFFSMTLSGAAYAAAPGLKVSVSGTTVTASVTSAPGLYVYDVIAVHSNATNSRVAWCYLNGTKTLPSAPLTSGTCTFTNIPLGTGTVYYDEYPTSTSAGTALTIANITVGAPTAPPPAPSASFAVSPNPVAPGKTVTFNASLNPAATASDITVTLWFYNSAGRNVGSASQRGVNFTSGQSTPVTITYAVPSSLAAGTYTYNLSYYNSSGTNPGFSGQTNAGGFAIGTASTSAASCTFNGQTIASGSSVMAYLASSVPAGQTCTSQTRACTNGALNGSYAYPSCSVGKAASCTLDGQTIASGSSVTAYLDSSVPAGQTCASQTRTCTNGTLNGSYAYPNCWVDVPSGNHQVKWNPGNYMMAAGAGASHWDIDTLAANDHSNIKGYASYYFWNQLENNVAGQYDFSQIVSDFNYLQSKVPGAHFAIGISATNLYGRQVPNVANLDVSGMVIPEYILNDRAQYGEGPPGAPQGGYGLSAYMPKTFTVNGKQVTEYIYGDIWAALWNENVMTRYMDLFDALAKTPLPLNGVNYTVDTNPLVEFVFDWGPIDLDMAHDNPIVPPGFSTEAWNQQWLRRMPAMAAAFPHTNVGLMLGYGGGGFASDQLTLLQAERASRVALTSTDIAPNCVDADGHCTWAQNYFMGNSYDATGWLAGGTQSFAGTMASMPTVEPDDYMYPGMLRGSGLAINTVSVVNAICSIATNKLHASHIFWASASESDFMVPKDWPGFILPGIENCDIPAANQAYPYAQ